MIKLILRKMTGRFAGGHGAHRQITYAPPRTKWYFILLCIMPFSGGRPLKAELDTELVSLASKTYPFLFSR